MPRDKNKGSTWRSIWAVPNQYEREQKEFQMSMVLPSLMIKETESSSQSLLNTCSMV
jgi:hypothetical protein